MNPLKTVFGAALGLVGAAAHLSFRLYTGPGRLANIDEQVKDLGVDEVLALVLAD